jgi:hypothetical protein
MSNPFDQFDSDGGNPFDQFDVKMPRRFQQREDRTPQGSSWAPDINTPAALLSGIRHGVSGNLGNYLDAATMGPMHYLTGREPSIGSGWDRALAEAQGQDKSLAATNAAANFLGRIGGGLGTGIAAGPMLGYNAAKGAVPTAKAIASYLTRNAAFGGLSGATEGDTLSDRLGNAGIGAGIGAGAAAVVPGIAKLAQAFPNAIQSGIAAARNLYTTKGHEGIAGEMLRESAGNFPIKITPSPLPGLDLRTTQATGVPGWAGMEQAMESRIRAAAGSAEDIVQAGRTPRQMATLSDALVPGNAGIEPRALLTQAGERGARSIQLADEAITKKESVLWGAIGGVKINPTPLAETMERAFAGLPEYQRAAAPRMQAYIDRVRELGPAAAITGKQSINGVRSDMLRAARKATTADERNAFRRVAGEMVDYIERAPEIAGRAERIRVTAQGNLPGGEIPPANFFKWAPQTLRHETIPSMPPRPDVANAWQSARDFTRESNKATGYREIDALLNSNAQGNIQANPAQAFAGFFPSSGSTEGVRRLEKMGKFGGGAEMGNAMRDYFRAGALNAGRTGGQDAAGRPLLSPGAIARYLNTRLPQVQQTPTFAGPQTSDLAHIAEAAGLLSRPQSVARVSGSNTFDKYMANQLLQGAMGQAGAPLLGGIMGAGIADYALPGSSMVNMPLGFAAGAAAASRGAAPALASTRLGNMITGPANRGIESILIGALENPNEAVRLMAIQLLKSRGLWDEGMASGAIRALGRGAAPAGVHGVAE